MEKVNQQDIATPAIESDHNQVFPSMSCPSIEGTTTISLLINEKYYSVTLEPSTTLLDALREYIGLTGTKKGCDRGQCGACTVLLNRRRINSCLTLAIMHERVPITTIENIEQEGKLHPVQKAFIDHDALQCGSCTPGQVLSSISVLDEQYTGSENEIREWMSGNLCRCGAYTNIVAAIWDIVRGKYDAAI